jgi:hypothetical protein
MAALHCVCGDAPSVYCDWMIYYTHHRKMAALHCVCVDVPSDYCADWNISYTHRRKMDALGDVCADAPSDYSDWLTYYSNHRKLDAPQHVQVDLHSANSVHEENRNITIILIKNRNEIETNMWMRQLLVGGESYKYFHQ